MYADASAAVAGRTTSDEVASAWPWRRSSVGGRGLVWGSVLIVRVLDELPRSRELEARLGALRTCGLLLGVRVALATLGRSASRGALSPTLSRHCEDSGLASKDSDSKDSSQGHGKRGDQPASVSHARAEQAQI
jgi:hypothetical protein